MEGNIFFDKGSGWSKEKHNRNYKGLLSYLNCGKMIIIHVFEEKLKFLLGCNSERWGEAFFI
jgi:hypothetical protein